MVGGRYILFLLLFICVVAASAQTHVFTEVKMNKSSVFVGEPAEVSVTVYTSTWFTKGVNPGNIKVEGAFTVYFRGVSVSKKINGKTYASVTLIYNVFPYAVEDILFPSLEFTVETPDAGGYKGVQRKVKTKTQTIKVKPVPAEFSKRSWLVATGVSISESWSGNRKNLKVGDVLARSITQTVSGTVSGLIPPVRFDTISGVSLYPDLSSSEDIRSKTSVSAKRTDGVNYLFEQEGEITIPAVEITWWNAMHKKLYKQTIKAETLIIQPNPDLGMLSTIRDSLNTVSAATGETGSRDDHLFMGLTKKQIAMIMVLGLLILILRKQIIRWLGVFVVFKKHLQNKRIQYLNSEPYHFRKFLAAASKGGRAKCINALYQWIDHLGLKEPCVMFFAGQVNEQYFYDEVEKIQKQIADGGNPGIEKGSWKRARKIYLEQRTARTGNVTGINP